MNRPELQNLMLASMKEERQNHSYMNRPELISFHLELARSDDISKPGPQINRKLPFLKF